MGGMVKCWVTREKTSKKTAKRKPDKTRQKAKNRDKKRQDKTRQDDEMVNGGGQKGLEKWTEVA